MTGESLIDSQFIGTSNHDFAVYAQEEIRRLIPDAKFTYLTSGEVFTITTALKHEQVISLFKTHEPIFLRHVHPVQQCMPLLGPEIELAAVMELLQVCLLGLDQSLLPKEKVTVQIRKADGFEANLTISALKEAIENFLHQQFGVVFAVKEAERVISVFLTNSHIYLGISFPSDNLSDWSGGAIRFRREENQISRAKFKLLEAEYHFQIPLSRFSNALDIGASPGGWTSLLLERGLSVTSVDPAVLHPTLASHPKLTFLKKNADDIILKDDVYDLLVCDMSWSPRQMTKLIMKQLHSLKKDGTAIITLKLMHRKPFQTVKEALAIFHTLLDIKHVKQLFHNREELTLIMVKK